MMDEDTAHAKRCDLIADSTLVARMHPSGNFGPRIGYAAPTTLILHYTGFADAERAIHWLAAPESRVSCHYVIDDFGVVTQMVSEAMRAWHAGESVWHGETDINSCSIGIEIQNPGHDRGYPEFPDVQMDAVIALCRDIIKRNDIVPERVLAHSDIAPHRKIDPGEKFDWQWLAGEGIGHWVAPVPPDDPHDGNPRDGETVAHLQSLLAAYGYGIPQSGACDRRTELVVTAFQRHFRPARVDGLIDASTLSTAEALIDSLRKD